MVTIDWLVFTWAVRHPVNNLYTNGFVSPPWALLFLPHAFLPPVLGVNVNRILTLIMIAIVIQARWRCTLSHPGWNINASYLVNDEWQY